MHLGLQSSFILMVLFSLLTSSFAYVPLLYTRKVSPDNTCGKTGLGGSSSGFTCPKELPCCSVNGFCGSTSDYCCTDTGCQSDFGVCKASEPGQADGSGNGVGNAGDDPERCGPEVGSCAVGKCCSGSGFCGTTSDHCRAPECQPLFGTGCDANVIPGGLNTSGIPRTKTGTVLYGSTGIFDCQKPGDVALTFDDGPYIYTMQVLDLLDKYGAKATFFITGNNNGKGQIDDPAQLWPDIIKRMYRSNHQLASHTWSHADLCNITSAQRKDEMYKLEMAMRNIVGVIPTYMRPPYSSCTSVCGCEQDMEDLGYHVTYFNLDTSDYLNTLPETIPKSQEIFSSRVNASNPVTDEFLVVAHDIHKTTAEVLVEHMLKEMTAKGYRGVTVGECLGDPKEGWYRVDTSTSVVLGW